MLCRRTTLSLRCALLDNFACGLSFSILFSHPKLGSRVRENSQPFNNSYRFAGGEGQELLATSLKNGLTSFTTWLSMALPFPPAFRAYSPEDYSPINKPISKTLLSVPSPSRSKVGVDFDV
jgi:hypothetical protein